MIRAWEHDLIAADRARQLSELTTLFTAGRFVAMRAPVEGGHRWYVVDTQTGTEHECNNDFHAINKAKRLRRESLPLMDITLVVRMAAPTLAEGMAAVADPIKRRPDVLSVTTEARAVAR